MQHNAKTTSKQSSSHVEPAQGQLVRGAGVETYHNTEPDAAGSNAGDVVERDELGRGVGRRERGKGDRGHESAQDGGPGISQMHVHLRNSRLGPASATPVPLSLSSCFSLLDW
jgi:hypothetical protein